MTEITIDLTDPVNVEAFADCAVGDTKILTVTEKQEGVLLTATVEAGEYESDEPAKAPPEKPMSGKPPKGVAGAVSKIR